MQYPIRGRNLPQHETFDGYYTPNYDAVKWQNPRTAIAKAQTKALFDLNFTELQMRQGPCSYRPNHQAVQVREPVYSMAKERKKSHFLAGMGEGSNKFYLRADTGSFGDSAGSTGKGRFVSKSPRMGSEGKGSDVPGVGSYDGNYEYLRATSPQI